MRYRKCHANVINTAFKFMFKVKCYLKKFKQKKDEHSKYVMSIVISVADYSH